jgi:threonine aldolase
MNLSRSDVAGAVDLRSDFLARPTQAMQDAWVEACRVPFEFGLREDPHQIALERRIAEMTGHEDALVFPTCTMANLAGIMLGSARGSRVLTHEGAHVITSEAGGAGAFAGVQLVPLAGDPVANEPQRWADTAGQGDAQTPSTSLFVLENTHNRAGGMPLPIEYTQRVVEIARARGIALHLDGSRLFHAATALGVSLATLASGFDTVSLSLNKGFGAPVAAALAGSRSRIAKAVVVRQRLGGGIRPTGPAAAATLAALDDLTHFGHSHRLARRLAEGLAAIADLWVPPPTTNIVVVGLPAKHRADETQARLAEAGLLALPFGDRRIRMVTYRGVTDAHADRAIEIVRNVLA